MCVKLGGMTPALDLPVGSIPLVGLGTWQLRGAEATSVVATAFELGYRHVDTATIYRNEAEIGRALAGAGSAVFVVTKVPADRASEARRTLEASLTALGVPAVDLWLSHQPPTDIVALWSTMRDLRDEGLTRAIGVSNYSTAQVDALIEATGEAPAVNQVSWNPHRADFDLLAHHRAAGVVVEGYSPLKGGAADHPVVQEIAAAYRRTPAQVVLRWHVEHDIVVIPKSARRERLAENLALFDFALTPEEIARIDALSR